MDRLRADMTTFEDDPEASWLSFDAETRRLLKQLAKNDGRLLRRYDPCVHGHPSTMG